MKRWSVLLAFVLVFGTGCQKEEVSIEPEVGQIKAISELAVMDCYYNNVAKFLQEDATGVLLWKKDKHFWVEYNGIVRVGLDSNLVDMSVQDGVVTIRLPEPKVLSSKVDETSLTEDSFIFASKSADVSVFDQTYAFADAQLKMASLAATDESLLTSARERVEILLKEYIKTVGEATGVNYTINWVYLDAEGNDI